MEMAGKTVRKGLFITLLFLLSQNIHAGLIWNILYKYALVIGNSEYEHIEKLINPKNDASVIAGYLGSIGYRITLVLDANKAELEKGIRIFSEMASQTDRNICFVFYAGHAVQIGSQNYLVPIDAKKEVITNLDVAYISFAKLLGSLSNVNRQLNIAIFDCCRNNPLGLPASVATETGDSSDLPKDSLIVFSTGPNQVSFDGQGANSIFVKNLMILLNDGGKKSDDISEIMKIVCKNVEIETKGIQHPEIDCHFFGNFSLGQTNDSSNTVFFD
jgi:hypothetical protein